MMGRFKGKPLKGISFATYQLKWKCFFSPRPTPNTKKFRTTTTKSIHSTVKSKLHLTASHGKRNLFDPGQSLSPMRNSPNKMVPSWTKRVKDHQGNEEPEYEVMQELGCSFMITEDSFKMPVEIMNDLENSEELDVINGQSRDITSRLISPIPHAVGEMKNCEGLEVVESFYKLVKEKKFPLTNISYLLWCDVVKWFSRKDTRSMRYSDECLQFFWDGKRLFGGTFLRFMSGLKMKLNH